MRPPFDLEAFVQVSGVALDDIERMAALGLLDPDGDGFYDDYDLLRARRVALLVIEGHSLEAIAEDVRTGAGRIEPLARYIFAVGGLVSLEEFARRVGMDADFVREVRIALGLPWVGFGESDVEAFVGIRMLVDAGFPREGLLELARVWGDVFRRLTDANVRLTQSFAYAAVDHPNAPDLASLVAELRATMTTTLEPMLLAVHRLHASRALAEQALAGEAFSPLGTLDLAVVFADLGSFTPLTIVHGDEGAVDVLRRFDGLVRRLALEHTGTLVKLIGDGAMLVFADPAEALEFACALQDAAAGEPDFPPIRVGIHAGPVLYRLGDYIGATVNIAARLEAAAMPGEILMTDPIAAVAQPAGVAVEPTGVRELRGVDEPLALYRVSRPAPGERDPVCGMVVGPSPTARLEHGGVEYLFCSEDCLRRFLAGPNRYAGGLGG